MFGNVLLLLLFMFFTHDSSAYFSPEIPRFQDVITSRFCADIYEQLDFYYPHDLHAPFEVEIDLIVEDISHLDGQHFEFDVTYLMYARWKDPRIVALLTELDVYSEENASWLCEWTPEDVWSQKQKLFDPVLQFENTSVRSNSHADRADWVDIYTDASIQIRLRKTSTFKSAFNLRRFPFDSQKLELVLSSEFDKRRLIFKASPEMEQYIDAQRRNMGEEFDFMIDIPEWHLSNFQYHIREQARHGENLQKFVIELLIDRNIPYYIFKIILPVLLMFLICWATLWIHPTELQTTTNISIVGFLSLITYNFMLSDELPKVNYITLIDVFIFTTYFYIGATLFLCALHHHSHINKLERVTRVVHYCRTYGLASYFLLLPLSMWTLW